MGLTASLDAFERALHGGDAEGVDASLANFERLAGDLLTVDHARHALQISTFDGFLIALLSVSSAIIRRIAKRTDLPTFRLARHVASGGG